MNNQPQYVDEYGLGGLLKALGGVGAGVLGMSLFGPLGAGLASGLYSGIGDRNLKKGLLSGLTAYLGSSALSDAGKAVRASNIVKDTAVEGVKHGAVNMPAASLSPEIARRLADQGGRVGVREGIRGLMSSGGSKAALDNLSDTKKMAFLYPQMGNLSQSISRDEQDAMPFTDPYEEMLAESRRKYRQRFGADPWGVRGYARGGSLFEDFFGLTAEGDSDGGGGDDIGRDNQTPDIEPGGGDNVPIGGGFPIHSGYIDWNDWNELGGKGGAGNDEPEDGRGGGTIGNDPDTGGDPDDGEDPRDNEPGPGQGGTGSTPRPMNYGPRTVRQIDPDFMPGFMGEYGYFSDVQNAAQDQGTRNMQDAVRGILPSELGMNDVLADVDMDEFFATIDGMAEGGQVPQDELVQATVQALMGQMDPAMAEEVIAAFVEQYGPDALEQLKAELAQSQQSMDPMEGPVPGGMGMDDDVLMPVAGQNPVALSGGEFVIPADAVSMLGDGNSEAGSQLLQDMVDGVRTQKTGSADQADPVNFEQLMG